MQKIHGLILDMDGVLWRGEQPIGNLPAIFAMIQENQWKVVLATNNSTRSTGQYLQKLKSFGVSLAPEQVITSAIATAEYLKRQHPAGGSVYVIGEVGLKQTLHEHGFEYRQEDVLAVVAGLDRMVDYPKLKHASLLIRSGVPFIGTNPDLTLPSPEGELPGAGSILAALEAASGESPLIIGKPEREMFQQALAWLGTPPAETLVVGDRYETDIRGGMAVGCPTALVLSGVTSQEDLTRWEKKPDFIAPDLNQILTALVQTNHGNKTRHLLH